METKVNNYDVDNNNHVINYGNIENVTGDDNRPYMVYCHIAPNGKIYIGQTHQTLEQRFKRGAGYNNCPHFKNAIAKHGWENFKHIELITGLSKEMADIVEIALIEKYNTRYDEFGYNMAYGGTLIPRTKKAYQYDIDGNFIKSYQSLIVAAHNCNISRLRPYVYLYDDIFHSCGYLWTLNYYGLKIDKNILDKVLWRISTHGEQERCRKVYQYDTNYNLIAAYKSSRDAAEHTRIRQNYIRNACEHYNVYGGYIWSYEQLDEDLINKYESILKCDPKILYQYSSDGELVNTYTSQTEAAKSIGANGTCGISACCNGNRLVSSGFVWSYEILSKEEVINRFYNSYLKGNKWHKAEKYLNEHKEN